MSNENINCYIETINGLIRDIRSVADNVGNNITGLNEFKCIQSLNSIAGKFEQLKDNMVTAYNKDLSEKISKL